MTPVEKEISMNRVLPLAAALIAAGVLGFASPQAAAESYTFTLKSGYGLIGSQDAVVWVQGAPFPFEPPGYASAGLPLQHPFVVPTNPGWGDVEGAYWVSPLSDGTGAPEAYEYFVPFYIPPGVTSVTLEATWRGDDAAYLAVNGQRFPNRASFWPNVAASRVQVDVTRSIKPGANRLSFFVLNSRVGINPTGLSFTANITFTF
jgi:hypothetical protein